MNFRWEGEPKKFQGGEMLCQAVQYAGLRSKTLIYNVLQECNHES